MHGYYIRFTPDELRRALSDRAWADETLNARLMGWFSHQGTDQTAVLKVDKAWHAIFHVLEASGMPNLLVYGYFLYPSDEAGTTPPGYLEPDDVRAVADWLGRRPFAELIESVDQNAARAADIYVVGNWDDDDRSFVAAWAADLPTFFTAAAQAGDAMIIHVS